MAHPTGSGIVACPALRRARGRIAVLAVLLSAAAACSQPEPRPAEELVRSGDFFLDPETLEPFTGTIYSTFAHRPRVVEQRIHLRNGTYDGPYEAYFSNRRLSTREHYRQGRRDGPYEWYFDSGRLYERGTYRHGVREGPYEAYWEDGEIHEVGTYRAGAFDGPRAWYVGGSLIEVVTYAHGVIDGLYERYDPDGSIRLRGILANGDPCGHWIEDGVTVSHPPCGVSTD